MIRHSTGKFSPKILGIVLALAVTAGLYLWYGAAPQTGASAGASSAGGGTGRQAGGAPVPVRAATATVGDFDVYLTALGTVTPLATTIVRPRVDGQLMKLHFTEGQLVEEGALLAEIDPRPFEVQLTQAEGQLAKDLALLKNAQLDLERYQTLLAQDSIARQQVDTQKALVQQYSGTVATDRGQVDSARLQLTYSKVTAPISGRVGLRQVDLGNIVQASDANGLVVITQEQPISVVFTIPEDNLTQVLQRVRADDVIPVDAYDRQFKEKLASGTLFSMDNQIDTQTGNIKMRAQFANEDHGLFPNQFVNVRMHVKTLRDVVLVPDAAVALGSRGAFVYTIDEEGMARFHLVKTGASSGGRVVIESGLEAGQRVVVDGLDKLRDGAKLEIVDEAGGTGTDEPKTGGAAREGQGSPNAKGARQNAPAQ